MIENTFDNLCRIGIAILFVAGAAMCTCGCVRVSSAPLRGCRIGNPAAHEYPEKGGVAIIEEPYRPEP